MSKSKMEIQAELRTTKTLEEFGKICNKYTQERQDSYSGITYFSKMFSLLSALYKDGWKDCEKQYIETMKNN